MIVAINSPVRTGTVDLYTTVLGPLRWAPIWRAADSTNCRSARPSESIGVPTAMKITSALSIAGPSSPANRSRPAATLRSSNSSSDGSKNGKRPWRRAAILSRSTSTHVTSFPSSAKHSGDEPDVASPDDGDGRHARVLRAAEFGNRLAGRPASASASGDFAGRQGRKRRAAPPGP